MSSPTPTPPSVSELVARAREIANRLLAASREIAAHVKPGAYPASKSSIEALPVKEVTGENGVTECPICLVEIGVGGEVREMPCKHGFHSDCIVRWLGIHGSCPICRFVMPVEENEVEGDGRRRAERTRVWSGSGSDDGGSESGGDGSEREMAYMGGMRLVFGSAVGGGD